MADKECWSLGASIALSLFHCLTNNTGSDTKSQWHLGNREQNKRHEKKGTILNNEL